MVFFSSVSVEAFADSTERTDRQAQFMAVYLLHFANFIEWPKATGEARNAFNLCFYAEGNVKSSIRELAGEQLKTTAIRLIEAPTFQVLKQCQIVFIEKRKVSEFQKIKQQTEGKPILFVSDKAGFIEQGGTIEYFIENNKLRFAVNAELAKETGLILSSKLLRIAKIVERKK